MTYAIVDKFTNEVLNIIEYDGRSPYSLPGNYELVLLNEPGLVINPGDNIDLGD